MKIAFVIYDLTGGGAEKVVSLLSLEMSKVHDVHIITFNDGVDYVYGGVKTNLDIPSNSNKFIKLYNIFKRAIFLRKVFKKEKFDKIYSFMESANFPSILASRKTIVSVRNHPLGFDFVTRFLMKHLYKYGQKVIVNSTQNKTTLEEYFNLSNVEVIYNPLNLEDINYKMNKKISFDKPFILSIGRLHRQKGLDILIKAYAKTQVAQDAKLLIFGTGHLKAKLEELASELGVFEQIIFMGKTENPYAYMKKAKLFVLSSRHEGFPNVLVEAMACGCPVISTDCPTGPSEILQNNLNGILVENEDISGLTKVIDKLYYNNSDYSACKLNALSYVKQLNVESIAQSWLKIK